MSTQAEQAVQVADLHQAAPDPIDWIAANPQIYKKFTPKQKAFLVSYTEKPTVKGACAKAGVTTQGFYQWLHRSKEFRAAFDCVKKMGIQSMEDEVVRRAMEGVEEPVFNKDGKLVGSKTKYSDTLLMYYLNGNAPEKYRNRNTHEHTGPGGGPVLTVNLLDQLVND